jgi:uncharacterized damage-inducible protein DinB
MSPAHETLLAGAAGLRSIAVARFVWQMEDQRRQLLAGVAGLTAPELEWQPAPGMNSIGMLLAHVAYAESHIVQVGIEGKPDSDTVSAIGLSEEQEGMPLAPGAPPSPALRGRPLADFEEMLGRARRATLRVASTLADEDLARRVVRQRPDGSTRVFDVAWVFYHLIEHEAGHRGQIGLLRHLARER